jgi:hypothetical protein
MESEREEEYVSLRLAHGDIENVIRLLILAKAEKNPDLKAVIVRYCIIEYAKPFKMSRGVFKKKFKPLDAASVFPSGNHDHDKLITERDQRIAHGDITAYNPKLHYWSDLDIFPIVQRPSHLCDKIAPLIEKMEELCDTVKRSLVDRLTAMETEFRDDIKKNNS